MFDSVHAIPLLAWQIGRMNYSPVFGALIIPDFFAQFLRDAYQNYGLLHGDMVRENKLCLFLNSEVIGRESRARGYVARRKRKLDKYRARW
jgi:hypothetical protein